MRYIKYLALVLLFFFNIISCRKSDRQTYFTDAKTVTEEKFLTLPQNADPILVRIANKLKEINRSNHVISKIIDIAGMPRWDFVEVQMPIESMQNISIQLDGVQSRQGIQKSTHKSDTTILIPFVLKNEKRVNSFMAVHLSDSIRFDLFRGKDFAHFGFDESENRPTAKALAMRCMQFDYKLFNYKKFKIIDKKLALSFSNRRDTIGIFKLNIDDSSSDIPNVKQNFYVGVTMCEGGTWVPDPNTSWDTYAQDHPPLVNVGGNCYTQWYYFNDANPSQQINLGTTPVSIGGGGTYAPDPYSAENRLPNEWDAIDNNGYYEYRVQAFENLLAADPFHPLPCDKLNILPLDDNNGGYGLMYKRVAQKIVSSQILARLDSIANVAPTSIFTSFKVQNISNAYGPVVNCDYFPVYISSLPPNISPDALVDFFRKYTSNFIDPSLGVSFSPYAQGSFSDAAKFYSPYEQSLGALVHIGLVNDGSVVESEYYRSGPSSPYKCRFTYSTITSPLDYNHPVSGNREFGIFANPGGSGYTFYTMGVDRTSDWVFGTLNTASWGFDAADALWSNVQQKMVQFINNNGGQAYIQTPVKARQIGETSTGILGAK